MKNKFLFVAAIVALGFTSCKKGDTGPQGPKGEPGNSATGKAWSYVYTNQQIDPTINEGWDEGSGTYTWSGTRSYTPDHYAGAADKGIVLVYFRTGANAGWSLGNLTTSKTEVTGTVSTNVFTPVILNDKLQVSGRTRSISGEGNYLKDTKYDMKIIIIENAAASVAINAANAASVERQFGLH